MAQDTETRDERDTKQEEMVTIVSDGGAQVQVPRSRLAETRPEMALFSEGTPVVPEPIVNPLLLNDAYVRAHGPAEPIRGRFQPPEEQHPALARTVAVGDTPDSEPARAHGRFAPAIQKDPNLMVDEETLGALRDAYGGAQGGTADEDKSDGPASQDQDPYTLSRADLNAYAASRGIENPESYPNKETLLEAVEGRGPQEG
jgi:hypothetical protein